MKVRIKFTKSGPLKFIGHLDVMRYFQKAIRRAGIDVEYSQGFNPHQIMSFAAPLGVGLTSDGEYLDVSLNSLEAPEVMISRLNEVMDKDLQIVGFYVLSEESKNAMSIVAAADYLVSVKDGYEFLNKEEFKKKFLAFFNQENIIIIKKSKKSENEVDIKPLIYKIAFAIEDFPTPVRKALKNGVGKTVAGEYENGVKVYLQLAAGSVNNLKPELVMEAFCQYAGLSFNTFMFQVHRMEVYAASAEELVPLDRMEETIVSGGISWGTN